MARPCASNSNAVHAFIQLTISRTILIALSVDIIKVSIHYKSEKDRLIYYMDTQGEFGWKLRQLYTRNLFPLPRPPIWWLRNK